MHGGRGWGAAGLGGVQVLEDDLGDELGLAGGEGAVEGQSEQPLAQWAQRMEPLALQLAQTAHSLVGRVLGAQRVAESE